MILKSGAKFEEKTIFCFKNDRNLENFDRSTKKSKKIALSLVLFCAKYITFDLRKYRGVVIHDIEESCKI